MPEPPRVALDLTSTQRPRLTGWERFALTYTRELARRPHIASTLEMRWQRPAGGRWSMMGRQLGWYGVGMARTVARRDVDVVHALAFPPGRTSRPTVWTVHDDLVLGGHPQHARGGTRIWTPLARRALGRIHAIVTDTHSVMEDLVRLGADRDRIHVATPGVPTLPDPSAPPPVIHVGTDRVVEPPADFVLAVGTMEQRKRPDVAMRAAELVGAPLVVVGRVDPGFDRSRLPAYRHTYLATHVSDGELAWLYANARTFVTASAYEGLDFPLLEALAAGTPAAASDIPVHRELAEGAASFAPVGDARALARAIERSSRPSGWSPPTWEACLTVYADVYRLVSGGPRAA